MTAVPLPVSVVIVTWNSADVLPAALAALGDARPAPAEIIVVDNASSDASLERCSSVASQRGLPLRTIANGMNRGFAAAANQGIADTTQPFVFLHNPDLRLLPDTLTRLVHVLEALPDTVASAGPKLLRAWGYDLARTDVLDSTGIVVTRDGRHFDRGAGARDRGQYDRPEDVFGITGAAVMIRRAVLERSTVEGEVFDEDFFAFREDVDLAWRLQGFGYRSRYEPSAVAFHRRTVTPERRRRLPAEVNWHSVKNRFLLRIHHADRGWLLRFGLQSVARDMVVLAACLTVERSSLGAFLWLGSNLRRHVRRRREILARRMVDSRELRRWFDGRGR